MKPAIRVENLSKRYRIGTRTHPANRNLTEAITDGVRRLFRGSKQSNGEGDGTFWALKDVSFEVQPGEVVGIIGRNGAGKSTLLKILSRIVEPTSGRAEVRGRIASLLEVGTGFHPELTGRENVYMNGSILGMSKREIDRKFDEIVAFAEIEQFIDTPVKRYSSGMYVRLAFAVAAHLDAEILVVDEVLAVGDTAFREKCIGAMRSISNADRTVFFVSHSMEVIISLCKTCVLLEQGRVRSIGDAKVVVSHYLSGALDEATGRFDLRTHPYRRGVGGAKILEAHVSSEGNSGNVLCSRTNATFTILVEPARPIRSARMAIAIEDAGGRRLLTVANYFHTYTFDILRTTEVTCNIPNFCLAPGRYLFSVSIGTKHDGLLDSVDCAGWLEVTTSDVFGTGEPYNPVYGPVLADSTWHCV